MPLKRRKEVTQGNLLLGVVVQASGMWGPGGSIRGRGSKMDAPVSLEEIKLKACRICGCGLIACDVAVFRVSSQRPACLQLPKSDNLINPQAWPAALNPSLKQQTSLKESKLKLEGTRITSNFT